MSKSSKLTDIQHFLKKKRFNYKEFEPQIRNFWDTEQAFNFSPSKINKEKQEFFLIDTPPAYANGALHHGHGMSYTHIDIIARYKRLRGYETLLPLCFDDNGLPTEKFTEEKYNISSADEYPDNFIELCKKEAQESIDIQTKQLKTLGFSYNHQLSYRTIDDTCSKITQQNFLELYNKGLIKRSYEPQLYCTDCRTSLSQADLETSEENGKLYYIRFQIITQDTDTSWLTIATTRPELLPACCAIFYNPSDDRYSHFKDLNIEILNPWNKEKLLLLSDPKIDTEYGSGLMMCSTFGDQEDIILYRKYDLPLKEIIGRNGTIINDPKLAGSSIKEARDIILEKLLEEKLLIKTESIQHMIPICERCKTPIEITMSWQWILDILSFKDEIISLAKQSTWYPEHMIKRLIHWTAGLKWNWIISRQRKYGIPIPLWQCQACQHIIIADKHDLPINPNKKELDHCPKCQSNDIKAETDVLDTWMTSSLTPQILREIYKDTLGEHFIQLDLRPQAHEIIRTWAFYTIYKTGIETNFSTAPWKTLMISGWGLGFSSKGKRNIKASKSSGGGLDPIELCDRYSTDAFRYWAAQARPGKDQHLEEQQLQRGKRLVTKIYNAAKFMLLLEKWNTNGDDISTHQTNNYEDGDNLFHQMQNTLKTLLNNYNEAMDDYNYTNALQLLETSFWNEFCSNFIEELKQLHNTNKLTLYHIKEGITILKEYLLRFEPFLPYITTYLLIILTENDANA